MDDRQSPDAGDREIGRPLPVPRPSTYPTDRPRAGERPISESIRRNSIHPSAPQSEALGRLLVERRLVELYALWNGTLVATFRGAGYAALRVSIRPDGRVLEDLDASEPDPAGETEGQLTIVREAGRLHLGTLGPPRRVEE